MMSNNGHGNGKETTGTPDQHYDLISVLYHALEGAETYEVYIEDAQEAGDEELAQFLRELRDQNRENAQRAMDLLQQRLTHS